MKPSGEVRRPAAGRKMSVKSRKVSSSRPFRSLESLEKAEDVEAREAEKIHRLYSSSSFQTWKLYEEDGEVRWWEDCLC